MQGHGCLSESPSHEIEARRVIDASALVDDMSESASGVDALDGAGLCDAALVICVMHEVRDSSSVGMCDAVPIINVRSATMYHRVEPRCVEPWLG